MTSTSGDRITKQTLTKVLDIALTCYVVLVTAYVVLIPVSNNVLLYSLFGSLATLAGISALINKPKMPKELLVPALLWAAFIVYAIVVALIEQAAYWPRTLVFFLFWPVVFSVISVGFRTFLIKPIMWVGAFATIFVSLIFIYDFLSVSIALSLPLLPQVISEPIHLRHLVDEYKMYKMTSHSLPSFIWWGGIWIASLFCGPVDKYLPPLWVRILASTVILAAACVAWRRAIIVVLIAAPVIAVVTYLYFKFKGHQFSSPRLSMRNLTYVFSVFAVAAIFAVALLPQIRSQIPFRPQGSYSVPQISITPTISPETGLLDLHVSTIAEDDQISDVIRNNEVSNLIHPTSVGTALVGNGIGAKIQRGVMLREIRPWQTELQYHAMFYWTGIVGLIFLLLTFVYTLKAIKKAFLRSKSAQSVLFTSTVGAICLLIANASNPYLQAPGHMWPLFLPIMIAFQILNTRENTSEKLAATTVI